MDSHWERYKIVRELGRGAMGVVYHAIDPNIGRPVAIKTIQLANVAIPGAGAPAAERLPGSPFGRHAFASQHRHHYDVEQQDELAFIAMEYWMDRRSTDSSAPRAIDPERMFRLLAQTAAALDYVHQKGIRYTAISSRPNIMIAADGTAKIADFGIAKITTSEQTHHDGSIVGTPHYSRPNRLQGQPVDGRSDQFS